MPNRQKPKSKHDAARHTQWVDDETLWRSFKLGDRVAFEFLYQQHIQQLLTYGYKITSNRSLIQDCIQDLFVELWESRERLANVASINYYLLKSIRYKIVRNLQYTANKPLDDAQYAADDADFERQLLQEETTILHSNQLTKALIQLPKRQQEAIHLRYFQELSNEEVADVMGVNYQSACKFIYTALKTLRNKLQLSSLLPILFSLCREFFKIL